MRLGCCGSIDDAAVIKAAGFDFLEVIVQTVLRGDEPSSTWDKTAPDPDKLPLPIEAANMLVPASRPIVGPQRDLAGLQDYMQRIGQRAQRLGIQRLVFGSGGARKRPEAVEPETAAQHLAEFTRMAGEVLAHHNVILVIEHLNKSETNTLNSLDDCRRLCEAVDHPNVQMLVDSYHYGLENESDDALLALDGTLKHVHVAEVVGRIQPGGHGSHSADAFDFDSFFCLLHKIGYDERVSLECKWTAPIAEVGAKTAEFLRKTWAKAKRCESAASGA